MDVATDIEPYDINILHHNTVYVSWYYRYNVYVQCNALSKNGKSLNRIISCYMIPYYHLDG
jgi:hypothetical protein